MQQTAIATPIVVDLDLTLILTDSLHEIAIAALVRKPALLFRAICRLPKGRHITKEVLAENIDLGEIVFPFRDDLIDWLRNKSTEGHPIHLCSAAHQSIVDEIANRLGIFVSATGSKLTNLKGAAKAQFLQQKFPDGFIYVGDSASDLFVFEKSEAIVLAGASKSVTNRARNLSKPILKEFFNPKLDILIIAKALRVHHWSKNFLIFVPLLLSHQWNTPGLVLTFFLAFLCLLALTSATYMLNDIVDLSADRMHWSKKYRAFASGVLPIWVGLTASAALLSASFIFSAMINPKFALCLLIYLVITTSYSAGLKRIPLLDLLIIGVLFSVRVLMGAILVVDPRPAWLLTFSVFFFFSLATAKRHTEIIRATEAKTDSLKSRGYELADAPLTLAIGISSALSSLVVMMLFIVESMMGGSMYTRPELLGGIPLVLSIWIGRVWLLSHRGLMEDDPVSFAIRDKVSIGLGLSIVFIFMLSL